MRLRVSPPALARDRYSAQEGPLRNGGEVGREPRVRQNVMLELGYFIGVLGRENVCMAVPPRSGVPVDLGQTVDLRRHQLPQRSITRDVM